MDSDFYWRNNTKQRTPFITNAAIGAAQMATTVRDETDLAFLATWLHHHNDAAQLLSAYIQQNHKDDK